MLLHSLKVLPFRPPAGVAQIRNATFTLQVLSKWVSLMVNAAPAQM